MQSIELKKIIAKHKCIYVLLVCLTTLTLIIALKYNNKWCQNPTQRMPKCYFWNMVLALQTRHYKKSTSARFLLLFDEKESKLLISFQDTVIFLL